jgi:hypothetical protein
MTTYCSSYDNAATAEEAVDRLLAAGVDGADVRVLMGTPSQTDGPAGGFAGPVKAGAPVGAFAGEGSGPGMGTFAGDAAAMPTGSFATIDRETVTTFEGRARSVHEIGHRRLVALLVEAGLDALAAKRDVQALHDGRVLVLVRSDEPVQSLL